MRLVGVVRALLRRLRVERGTVAFLFVLVALTSFAVAAGPRLFNRVADDGLRHELAAASTVQRNLQFSTVDQLPPSPDDPFGRVVARGGALWGRLPDSVQPLIEETHYVVETSRFRVIDPPRFTTFVTFRQQDGLDAATGLVEGRWPVPLDRGVRAEGDPPRFEIALSVASAAMVGVGVGDTLEARVDPSDPLFQNVFPRPTTAIEIDVVGLFAVREPTDRFWYADSSLAEASIGGSEDAPVISAVGVFAPGAYSDLLGLDLPFRYHWRAFVDVARVDAGGLDELVPDLRLVASSYATGGSVRAGSTLFRSGLLAVVERYLDRRSTSEAVLSVAALGPLTVAATAVGLIGVLVVTRRRPTLALARGRGASVGQLVATQIWESLLVAVPAALVGLLAAQSLVVARSSALSATGAILVALGATALLAGATWRLARRARRELERDDPPVFRLAPRRLVLESVVVGLSLAAAWLLRERGVAGADSGGAARGFDPFLAASPLLVGLSVGLLTIRLYPLPIRALSWLAARRRDLVPVLGLRSLGRHPTSGYLPLVILMLTVAIGTFSSVLATSIERSQAEFAWQETGADYRIESPGGRALPADFDPAAVPGVEAVAAGLVMTDAAVSTGPDDPFRMLVEAIEPTAYSNVLAGSPVALGVPESFAQPPIGPTVGTADDPIPAVLSTRRPNGSDAVVVGDRLGLEADGGDLVLRIIGFRETFPGIPRNQPFAIVPYESLAAATRGSPLRPNVLFVRGGAGLTEALAATAPGALEMPLVTSRDDRFRSMRDAPLVAAVVGGFIAALVVATGYAALAVVAVVILHAQRRSREMAFLRTLGVSGRQLNGLTLVEQGLPVILALAIGLSLGLGLAWLLAPGLDLAAFSSPEATVPLRVDPPSIGGLAVAVVTVVALSVGVSSWLAGRRSLGGALRIGEE